MKISVIVSTYNRPDALVRVLDGLLMQSRLPDEIIIADDGSKDETQSMIQPYLDRHPTLIHHVWQADEGFRLARIRNLAIAASTCDYLVFLDGDCIPEKHYVEDHLHLAEHGCFFQGKRVIVEQKATDSFTFTDTLFWGQRVKHALTGGISNSHHIIRIPFFPAHTTSKLSGIRGCNMGFFKEDLLAVNGFNQSFTGWGREDSEIVVRLYKYGVKRKEHPFRAICYHLWHRENDRARMDENDHLLDRAIASNSYICESGINENE